MRCQVYRRSAMAEVGVAELRRTLKEWLDHVRAGDDVIITERGRAVARLTAVESTSLLDRLVAEGRVSRPTASRPKAAGAPRVRSRGSVSELITEERDKHR
jgi:prevent-host-death family protein